MRPKCHLNRTLYKRGEADSWFRELQLLFCTAGKIFCSFEMFSIVLLLSLAAFASGTSTGGSFKYGYSQRNCQTKYNVKIEQECHQEYDTVVETTYLEQCRDVVSQHCSPVPAKVHRGYGKREAEPGYGHGGYSVRPVCRQKVERRCEKVPQQESRQVARPVCQTVVDTTYVEECQETLTTECRKSHGYGKREAEAGYYRPVCEKKVERQCERVPRQQARQVARPVCEKVPREECQEVKVKVPRKVCEEYGYSVHH